MKSEAFVVTPLGLENHAALEIQECKPFLLDLEGRPTFEPFELEVEKGGVLVSGDLNLILQLNFFLKIPVRILLRLTRFKATEFFELEKRAKAFDRMKWFGDQAFSVKIEAAQSKLGQEKRIFDTLHAVWPQIQMSKSGSGLPQLYIRNLKDQFTFSFDLSGDPLYQRQTDRDLGGPAPIRENLAAALVRFLISDSPLSEPQQVKLIDPFAGSGTLLSEASQIYQPNFKREYSFQKQNWIPKIMKSESFLKNYRLLPERTWKSLMAIETHEMGQERLKNLAAVLRDTLEVFARPQSPLHGEITWVIANPPYGERLEAIPTPKLQELLLASQPQRVAVILPVPLAQQLKRSWPKEWSVESLEVSNGGIPCLFLRFQLSRS